MGSYLKRTATKAEIKNIQKAIKQGIPARVVAKDMGIVEECIINFLSEDLQARMKAEAQVRNEQIEKQKAKAARIDKLAKDIQAKEAKTKTAKAKAAEDKLTK